MAVELRAGVVLDGRYNGVMARRLELWKSNR